MQRLLIIATSILIFLFCKPDEVHCAQNFEQGDRAAKAGDFIKAFKVWEPLAETGDPAAQYGLCFLYSEGYGVPQNLRLAAEWCRSSADQGFAKAQYSYGRMYIDGTGVKQNYNAAIKWFRLSAKGGNSDAQNDLGSMFANGMGVAHDPVSAFVWFSLSADQGNPVAIQNRDRLARQMSPEQLLNAKGRIGRKL